MKQLITTIGTALLVGCASLDSSSKVQPSLELTKDGLLVEPESQAPYTGRQSAKFNSGATHWEGSVVDGKRVRAVYPGWTGKLEEKSNRWGWVEDVYTTQDRKWLRYKPSRYPFRYFQRVMNQFVPLPNSRLREPNFDAPYIN